VNSAKWTRPSKTSNTWIASRRLARRARPSASCISRWGASESAEDFRRAGEQSLQGGGITAWRYLARRRAGDDEPSAQTELAQHRTLLKNTTSWPAPLLDYLQGRLNGPAVIAAARLADGDKPPSSRCLAEFFIGETLLLREQLEDARKHLREAVERCPASAAKRMAQVEIGRVAR